MTARAGGGEAAEAVGVGDAACWGEWFGGAADADDWPSGDPSARSIFPQGSAVETDEKRGIGMWYGLRK